MRSTNPTDSMARASEALEHLDVAPGLEELEMARNAFRLTTKP
ncbi:ribonucleoside-diphosphate reductase, beta subunit domain protein [Acinetobacter baumannii 655555]|nr:ribonucleoside-diphosphate reductase, beta subunit domain protein [Acinetobacter baumannii 655555]